MEGLQWSWSATDTGKALEPVDKRGLGMSLERHGLRTM